MADVWTEYAWIVVVGSFVAFFMAYGIGANDVANAFATSVGSKTLTLMQAVIAAAIFEFSGALLLGRGVTSTIKSGIVDPEAFVDAPEILMYGMFSALLAAGTWLLVATYYELPVSTTHSIFGGVIGMGLVAHGSKAVNWHARGDPGKFPIEGVSAVVVSWIISPVLSGIVAVVFFWFARTFILRSENSYDRAFMFLPVLVFITVFINAFFVLDKGIEKQWTYLEDRIDRSAWIATVIAVVCGIIMIFVTTWLRKRMDASYEVEKQKQEDREKGVFKEEEEAPEKNFFGRLVEAINSNDPLSAVDDDVATRDIHDAAEVFEERTEGVFRYLQVLTACADSFSHGANDVANSVGPFSAIYAIYKTASVESDSDVEIWILFIGGVGIVIGLATYGYSIIKAIGVKLTKITPSRGFSIELGSALVIATGSYYGLPLSTTHCQVGATAAVGLLEGGSGISWKVMNRTMVGWVMTLVVVGFLSAIIMSLGVFTPNLNAGKALTKIKGAVNEVGFAQADQLTIACPQPATQENILAVKAFYQDVTEENFKYPLRVADAVTYMGDLNEAFVSDDTCSFPVPADEFAFAAEYDYEAPEVEEEE